MQLPAGWHSLVVVRSGHELIFLFALMETYPFDLSYMIPHHKGRTILSSVASSDSFVSVLAHGGLSERLRVS